MMMSREKKLRKKNQKNRWTAIYRIVPDEQPQIEAALRKMADEEGCTVVVTTGGTGPAPRDVTPEATVAVRERKNVFFFRFFFQVFSTCPL